MTGGLPACRESEMTKAPIFDRLAILSNSNVLPMEPPRATEPRAYAIRVRSRGKEHDQKRKHLSESLCGRTPGHGPKVISPPTMTGLHPWGQIGRGHQGVLLQPVAAPTPLVPWINHELSRRANPKTSMRPQNSSRNSWDRTEVIANLIINSPRRTDC